MSFDIAIVGFGPSGAVAAGLLGGMGLKTFVCDKQRAVYDKPRAISLDHEILRVFQQLGVLERVLPHIEPFTDSHYFGVDGQLIKCLSTIAPPYPLGHVPSAVFSQPPVETALRAHAAALPAVELLLGAELRSLTHDASGVDLHLQQEDGSERSVRARYVIGCDGASSTVRALAGLALQDLEFDEPWLVVDALVNERGLAKLPATSVQYCEPQRPCSFLIGPGNHRRWEIALHADEDPAEMATEAGAWRLLARWLTPDDARLWRQASYRFHALVAQRWRQGRVFIAGDAAHQQPPFLGQGMCQGVRDVANLSWKLRAVLTGTGNDALLDTYGEERGLHVRQLTERIKGIGAVICERDIGKARERDARLVAEAGGRIRPMPRQDVLPRLEAGLIDTSAHAAVGSLFPQPWIARPQPTGHAQGLRAPLTSDSPAPEPVRLDALAGHGWRLVLGAAAPAPSPRCFDAAQAIGLATLRIAPEPMPGALHEVDGVLARWFERHGCSAAIVRPDHYVYGVCSTGLEIDALVQALALRLGADTPAAITRQPETAPC